MIAEQAVHGIKDVDSLLTFLREELNWQLPRADFGDITFEWTGSDLNLSEDVRNRLKDGLIHQLQPFADPQPWGIFVVDFAIPDVSVVTLRQVLRCLVAKKRGQRSDTPSWDLKNLLFICLYGDDGFTFAHFEGDKPFSSRLSTFSWHPGDPIRTVCEFNLPALKYDDIWETDTWLTEWRKAFDVEKVNKAFYKDIATLYYRLTGKEGHRRELTLPSVGRGREADKVYEEFAVRLIGRSIFCWFLKHKASDAGLPLVPHEIVSLAAVEERNDYYHSVLEPLFFEVMNKPAKDRVNILIPLADKVPFLNGGLFEPHRDDFYVGIANYALKVPNEFFLDFFALLERYNFTISESSSIDVDVSVDPEMLGRIFENLLAEVVPETGESARKATGSYYTPRVIVDYMVEQSLTQHLLTKTNLGNEKIARLLAYGEDIGEGTLRFGLADKVAVVKALNAAKIIDPACGSGAFPIGILHRVLMVMEKVDPKLEIWRGQYLASLDPIVRQIVEKNIRSENWSYIRKLMIIRDLIYGVDIQPIAVEIAKLRCFLSLIVDEIAVESEPNRGIEPLPNLEFKFVAANTLIGLPEVKNRQVGLEINGDVERLRELRTSYLRSYGNEKKQIEKEFLQTRGSLLEHSLRWGGKDALALQLANWDPFSNEPSAWFDPDWMFGLSSGFDIVIGNPPYLESRSPNFDDKLKDDLRVAVRQRWGELSELITRGSDLLVYFVETGVRMIRDDGAVVLITQNAWLDTLYGKKLQNFLMQTTDVLTIADSDYKYFDSRDGPNVNTIISVFKGRHPTPDSSTTFARFHDSFDKLSYLSGDYPALKRSGQLDYSEYQYSNPLLRETKWGILLAAEDCVLTTLRTLQTHGLYVDQIKGQNLSFGQGLNLSSDYIVEVSAARDLGVVEAAIIPFMTSSDGAQYVLSRTEKCLIDGSRLTGRRVKELKAAGIGVFEGNLTKKKRPALIMPRGISRHYCAANEVRAYSSSCVDLYDDGDGDPIDSEPVLNLWLFLNSSVGWLLREISGRKNLGGGLLKAEAADISQFPVYLNFDKRKAIERLYRSLRDRETLNTVAEIDVRQHVEIDDIVCARLEIRGQQREDVVSVLKKRLQSRATKSAT